MLKQNTCLWGRVLLTRLKIKFKNTRRKRTRGIKIRAVNYGFT